MSKKIIKRVKVKNSLGLHARPATSLAKMLQGTRSEVLISYKKETVNARSIMSILMLAVRKNSLLTIAVEGDDAETVMDALIQAFENQFGEAS